MSNIDRFKGQYPKMVDDISPKNTVLINTSKAFLVGGVICSIGQFINNTIMNYGLSGDEAATFTSVILIFLGSALTSVSIYEKIAKHAGAGSAIPITGFANSMVSAAMEHKSEGYVFGLGANIFKIAGPVLVYGIISSSLVGLLYYFFR